MLIEENMILAQAWISGFQQKDDFFGSTTLSFLSCNWGDMTPPAIIFQPACALSRPWLRASVYGCALCALISLFFMAGQFDVT
jgi:hypothetical protein